MQNYNIFTKNELVVFLNKYGERIIFEKKTIFEHLIEKNLMELQKITTEYLLDIIKLTHKRVEAIKKEEYEKAEEMLKQIENISKYFEDAMQEVKELYKLLNN